MPPSAGRHSRMWPGVCSAPRSFNCASDRLGVNAMTNHQTLDCGGCGGSHRVLPTRRSLLKVGGLSLFGLPFSGILQAKEQRSSQRARAKAVIFLHQFGGPSQTDTVDMKPKAPEAIRGEFKPVPT